MPTCGTLILISEVKLMQSINEAFWWFFVLGLGVLAMYVVLGGCAYMQQTRDIQGGMGTISEFDQGFSYTVIIHGEERSDPGWIGSLVETINSVPKAVAAVLTGPQQVAEQGIGGNRGEVMMQVKIKNAKDLSGDELAAIIEQVNGSLESAQVDARIPLSAVQQTGVEQP